KRRKAADLCRRRNPLRMIAGGICNDATLGGVTDKSRDAIPGAAEFERAGALKGFGLDEDPPPDELIEMVGFDERGPNRKALEPFAGILDICKCRHGESHEPTRLADLP